MCGIAGWFAAGLGGVEPALAALRHRGPSGTATYESPDGLCRLGLARLALVRSDLTARVPRSGPVVSVSNGELYDYAAIARELGVEVEVDTDLLPLLWRRRGPKLLARLRGPLAAALYDEDARELVLLRDAVGKRPLFYARAGSGVAFASEQKALLAMLPTLTPSPAYVEHVLALGYTRETLTPFIGVEVLEPGECLRVSSAGARRERADALAPGEATVDDVLQALLEAARLRRPSPPVTAAIALGGMDSLVLSDLLGHPPGFTIDRDAAETAAASAARQAADAAAPRLLEVPRPDRASTRRALKHLEAVDSGAVWGMAASTLALADAVAASTHPVLFTGEGADEAFMGYGWQHQALGPLPEVVGAAGRLVQLRGAWREALLGFSPRERSSFLTVPVPLLLERELERLVGRPCRPTLALPAALPAEAEEAVRAIQLQSLRVDMLALPVLQNDRLFMAAGIETRMPFLDRRVLDAALGLKRSALIDSAGEKPVVRALFLRAYGLPAPAKKGFGGAEHPHQAELLAWAEEVAPRARHVDGAVLLELAASQSWLVRELAWRGVLLEELYDVLGAGAARA